VDGREVARNENKADRATDGDPLIIGREWWGGDPPKGDTPGFFVGLLDQVKMWARALPAEGIGEEFRRS
jgi:hypothetical protein